MWVGERIMWSLTSSFRNVALVAVGCSSILLAALPDDWYLSADPLKYDAGVDPRASLNGQPSMYLRLKPGIKTAASGVLGRLFDAAPYAGKRVRFSAFVKSERIEPLGTEEGYAGLWMRIGEAVKGETTKALAFDSMHSEGGDIKGTTAWRYHAIVLDVPDAATVVWIGIELNGSGA